uniref:Granulins domain-containing protein n=1 Tax=Tetraodon nigroviridis TaxID=99883 RepID=H3D121_TETNG
MLLAVVFSGVLLVLVGADELPGGRFAVCREQEVLCPDRTRCCPEGHLCSTDGRSCVKTGILSMFSVYAAQVYWKSYFLDVVRCSDSEACPDKFTCCKDKSDKWTCCPLEQAVCCSDGIHCCPAHYKCDPQAGSCVSGDAVMSWFRKLPATLQIGPDHQDVKCDDQTSCEDGQTCCRMSPSTWGCCPFPQAVCCNDMKHCCPTGYTCTGGQCSMNSGGPRWFKLEHKESQAAHLTGSAPTAVRCAGVDRSIYHSFPLSSFLKAVCCNDMKHCCPTGYTCTGGQCSMNSGGPRWFNWNT